MWLSRRRARELVEAAGRDPRERGEVGAGLTRLLDAAGVLVAAAPAPPVPDPQFSANLKASLLSRFDQLVSAGERPAHRAGTARRAAWIALPAAAAVAAVLLALAFFVFGPSGPAPVARLTVQNGYARLITESGTEKVVDEVDVHEGDTVSLPGGSRATITYENDNITRLEAGSKLTVAEYAEDMVAVELEQGRSYNRVIAGTAYWVECRGVTVRSAGTAYGVDAVNGEISVPVFESGARVSWPGAVPTPVGQGFEGIVTGSPGSYSIQVVPLDIATLDFSWLAFNRDLDEKLGFPLGVLENLAPTPPQGIVPPGTPDSSAPSQSSQPTQPGSQPTQPASQPSSSLTLTDGGPPVFITWSASNVSAADTVAVLRAEGGAVPSYPANVLDVSQGSGQTSYHDEQALPGNRYTYRVAYISGGSVLVYSNSVMVTVPLPPPSLSLVGDPSASNMYLAWNLSGGAAADSFAVLRSEGGDPSYPGDVYATTGGGTGGKYIDYKVGTAYTFNYRVVAISGGRVIATSNMVSWSPQGLEIR